MSHEKVHGICENKCMVDITAVDNLESDETIKPLTARQGKILKGLIDTINNTIVLIQEAIKGKAASEHGHAASDITSGTLPIARGGTGANSAASALKAFGINATIAELNYLAGVTSAVQTQLNGKAASSHNHSASNITSGTLSVARGGTGASTFTSGAALIGAGTGAVTTRAITDNTSSAACSGTNLATCNTVNNHTVARLGRADSVMAANTAYTTHMVRAIALSTVAPSSLNNGCITFVYQ